jgi:pilus assembly protein CpaB
MRVLGGKGVLILALLLGGVTSYLSWRFVQETTAAASPVQLVPVLVATKPVAQRTIISKDMVQVRQVPVDVRPPGAFTQPDQVVGKVSKSQLGTGEQLLPHQFFLQRERSGLAFMVPESHRALAVAVSEVIGSGGLIIPGDRVDVYALFDLKEPDRTAVPPRPTATPASVERIPEKNTMVALVLQNLEVLAVGQGIEGDDTRSDNQRVMDQATGASNGAPISRARPAPQARSVTLSVSPTDAEKLILAEERGKIRLALRPASENGYVDVAPLELREILQAPTQR